MKKWKSSSKGFTLVELLIALSLTLLIGAAVSKILVSSIRTSTTATTETYAQKNARIALRTITKDLMDAETITTPDVGAANTSDNLTIRGITKKNVAMVENPVGTFSPDDNVNAPWVNGKPVVIYRASVSQSGGYSVNYANGSIGSTTLSADGVTADFSYDIRIQYAQDAAGNGDLRRIVRRLDNSVVEDRVIASGVTFSGGMFNRTSNNLVEINLNIGEYSVSTTLDISAGTYIEDRSNQVPAGAGDLNSLYFSSENNGWIAGDGIFRFSNGSWREESNTNVAGIDFADSSTGHAVANNPTTIHRYTRTNDTTGTWSAMPSDADLQTGDRFNGIAVKDSNDITLVGDDAPQGQTANYNGSDWLAYPRPLGVSTCSSPVTLRQNDVSKYGNQVFSAGENGVIKAPDGTTNNWLCSYDGATGLRGIDIVPQVNPGSFDVWSVGSSGVIVKNSCSQCTSGNIVQNNSFETDVTTNWGFWVDSGNGANASRSVDSTTSQHLNKSAKITITNGGPYNYSVQFYQTLSIVTGNSYTLSFYAKADGIRTIRASVMRGSSPWTDYGFNQNNIALTTSWQKYSYTFTATGDVNATLFLYPGISANDVWFDGVNLESNGAWSNESDPNITENLNSVDFFDESIGWAVGDCPTQAVQRCSNVAGNEGVIIKYDRDLDAWHRIPSGIRQNLNKVFMYSRDEGYIVGDNGTLIRIGSIRQ